MSVVAQAMSQLAIVGPIAGGTPNTFTMPCPGGGSIVTTMDPLPLQQPGLFHSSSKIEFRDCKNQAGTLNGDPYLETSGDFSFPTSGGTIGDSVSTLRTTGGLRMDTSGVLGRVQFNCTMTVSVHLVNGTPQLSITSDGTTTFEQPLGSTPVVRPCGPA